MPDRDGGRRARFSAVLARVPRGRVVTYGQVARLAGWPGAAREVGRFLFQLPSGTRLPWHRVVNARGEVSYHPARQGGDDLQRLLLQAEGVAFDARGRIDLDRLRWDGGRSPTPAARRSR
jgi:methylated-DNA-protein-cysteine methyltransferase-like protein